MENTPLSNPGVAPALANLDFMQYVGTLFSDPGHSWLAVQRKRIDALGLTKQISSFSYMDSEWLYLEEDADRSLYLQTEGLATPQHYRQFWGLVATKEYERCWVRDIAGFNQERRPLQHTDVHLTLAKEPWSRSYILGMGNTSKALVEEYLKGQKPLCIDISAESKTRIHLSMQCGEYRLGINVAFGDYKFAQKEKYTFMDHERYTASYFVLSKKQHIGVFEQYLKLMLAHIFRLLPRQELNVLVWDTKDLRAFRANYPDPENKSVLGKELAGE
jgi:hypothetical protein